MLFYNQYVLCQSVVLGVWGNFYSLEDSWSIIMVYLLIMVLMKTLRIGMLIGFISSQMLQPMVWATDINDADVDPALIQQAVNSSFTTEEQAA